MAPRAYWKGYLKLSLVSCPIALYPATSDREKISFHQINKKTGHRIKYQKVDAETGEEVAKLNGKFEPSTLASHIDAVGTYYPAFLTFAVLYAVAIPAMLLVKRPARPASGA